MRSPWGAALLLAPHIVLGVWLVVVPDYLAFRTSQIVTLVHVALAVLSAPFIVLWAARHIIRRGRVATRYNRWSAVWGASLGVAALGALVTGGVVAWGGEIARANVYHAAFGLAVGVPLVLHLWSGDRRGGALGVAALLLVALVGPAAARALFPPRPIDADVPTFAFKTTRTAYYQSAKVCGECHVEQYTQWKQSTHGRTMENPLVRKNIEQQRDSTGLDLDSFARIIQGANVPHADVAFNTCEMCHAPTGFYGDDQQDLLHAEGTPSEGVTCSFCHTLRAVVSGKGRGEPIAEELLAPDRRRDFLPLLPYYVSAPQTVRRYLGEDSENPVVHWVWKLLVRWRPTVHRHDYHSPVLRTSIACMPCHSEGALDLVHAVPNKTYRSWEVSRFNTDDPSTSVTCQNCHMVRVMTGEKASEPGRLVPWGPIRTHQPNHLFLGGNRTVPDLLKDDAFSTIQHDLNRQIATVAITGMRRQADGVVVDLRVASTKIVGHDLPSMGAQNRWLWVSITVEDSAGKRIGYTKPPEKGDDRGSESPVIFRCIDHPSPDCDTLLRPGEPRAFTAQVKLAPGARPAKVTATLWLSVDREAIAEDVKSFTR